MSASDHLSNQQFIDLYHNTSPEAAAEIQRSHRMISKESGDRVFFTTDPHSEYASGFGPAQVHVRIPQHWTEDDDAPDRWGDPTAQLNDEFPSGEKHYAVKIKALKPRHFVRSPE